MTATFLHIDFRAFRLFHWHGHSIDARKCNITTYVCGGSSATVFCVICTFSLHNVDITLYYCLSPDSEKTHLPKEIRDINNLAGMQGLIMHLLMYVYCFFILVLYVLPLSKSSMIIILQCETILASKVSIT